jgi:hypothetical protein
MSFWLREVAGWFFIALGLFVFYRCYLLLTDEEHRIFEGASMTLVGVVIFRGGIHLLKVATAAEVCLQAEQKMDQQRPSTPRNPAHARGAEQVFSGRRFP